MTAPRTILSAWNVYAKKQFGQNFLADPSTTEMIVRRSGIGSGDIIVEIGAGLGALTIPAARAAEKVYAIEKDRQLVPLLRNELHAAGVADKVEILHEDVIKIDINRLAEVHGQKVIVIGNLPYNISSQILIWLVKSRVVVHKAVFMFQKELAERIAAPPGSKDYGRISAVIQYCGKIKHVANIGADLFFPKPKVDSSVVEIQFYEKQDFPADNEEFLFSVIKAAFGKRRKNLKNALTNSELDMDAGIVLQALENASIDYKRRAETLTVEEFVHLSNVLGTLGSTG